MNMKIYKFYADWCMPCKSMQRKLEQLELDHMVTPVNVDSEEGRELVKSFGIRSIPVLACGDIKLQGDKSPELIKEFFEQVSERYPNE